VRRTSRTWTPRPLTELDEEVARLQEEVDAEPGEGATGLLICQHQAARRVDDDLGVWRQLRGHIVKARLARDRGRCFLFA